MYGRVSRRSFLHGLGFGGLGALLVACTPPAAEPTKPAPTAAGEQPTSAPATAAPVPTTGEEIEVEFVMNDSPGWADALHAVMAMFTDKHPNIKPKFTPVEWNEIKTVVTPRFAAGDPPATLLCDSFWPWVEQRLILDMNPFIDRDKVDLSLIADLGAGKLFGDPARYGLPFDFTGSVVAYNKTLCEKYGVEVPKKGWTTDDLRAAAIKLTRDQDDRSPADAGFDPKNIKVYGLQLANMFFWGALVNLFGGRWWSEDGKTCLIDEAKAMDAFLFFNRLACEDHALYGPQPSAGPADTFVSQQVAITIEGEWMLGLWKDIADFDWDVAAWPKGREEWQYGGSDAVGIAKGYKHPDAAWEFVKFWIFDKEAAMITGAIMPPALNEAGLSEDVLKPRLGQRGPTMENMLWAYTNMRQHSDCSLYYMSTNAQEWQPLLGDVLTSLLTLCDQPAEDAVKDTAQQITTILNKPKA